MSGLTVEVIEYLQGMVPVKDRIVDIEGRAHTVGQFTPVKPPPFTPVKLATLAGFADFAMAKAGEVDYKNLKVTIDDHKNVSLSTATPDEDWHRYDVFAKADADPYIAHFDYGHHYDAEQFIIQLQTSFVNTPQRAELIKVASNLSADSENKISDDGMTQSTTIGRAVKTKVNITNPVTLEPFRSFHEVECVASPFVFRIHGEGRNGPTLALYESDSGKWKLDYIERIHAYLSARLGDDWNIYK